MYGVSVTAMTEEIFDCYDMPDEIKSDEKCTECGEWFGDHMEGCKND